MQLSSLGMPKRLGSHVIFDVSDTERAGLSVNTFRRVELPRLERTVEAVVVESLRSSAELRADEVAIVRARLKRVPI